MPSTVVVAVDVGKRSFAVSVSGADRRRLLGPVEVAMTRPALDRLVEWVRAVLPGPDCVVRVGVEPAGHCHQPLIAASGWPADPLAGATAVPLAGAPADPLAGLPAGWQVWELNPAHVTEQRRVMGRRRVKTDAIDLEAIIELLLAGRGHPVTDRPQVLGELTARSAHRSHRVAAGTATKNQLLGQLDRAFPGLTLVLPDVLGTKIGRLVAREPEWAVPE